MRWLRWPLFVVIEIFGVAVSAAAGLLENILTNEEHPEHAVVIGLVTVLVLTVVGQSVGRILSARRDEQSVKEIHGKLDDVGASTQKVLDIHADAASEGDEREIDQALT